MVDHTNNDTIDEEFTSNEEPSVAEFKNWMYPVFHNIPFRFPVSLSASNYANHTPWIWLLHIPL